MKKEKTFWNFPTKIKLLKYLYYLKEDKNISDISYDLQISFCLATTTFKKMKKEGLVNLKKVNGLAKNYYLTETGKKIAEKLLDIERLI